MEVFQLAALFLMMNRGTAVEIKTPSVGFYNKTSPSVILILSLYLLENKILPTVFFVCVLFS